MQALTKKTCPPLPMALRLNAARSQGLDPNTANNMQTAAVLRVCSRSSRPLNVVWKLQIFNLQNVSNRKP